jgi:hypothetical protein
VVSGYNSASSIHDKNGSGKLAEPKFDPSGLAGKGTKNNPLPRSDERSRSAKAKGEVADTTFIRLLLPSVLFSLTT